MARIAAGGRLTGKEDFDERKNMNENGFEECSIGSNDLTKQSRTRGITTVDSGC